MDALEQYEAACRRLAAAQRARDEALIEELDAELDVTLAERALRHSITETIRRAS